MLATHLRSPTFQIGPVGAAAMPAANASGCLDGTGGPRDAGKVFQFLAVERFYSDQAISAYWLRGSVRGDRTGGSGGRLGLCLSLSFPEIDPGGDTGGRGEEE